MGNARSEYEYAFAEICGAKRAFSFWKGRVGLYALLKAMGIGPGDEVIVPGYTCVVAVNPIKYLGATPVYVDIEPATFNMDVDLLEEKITPKSKVIIAQHTYGYPCDIDAVMNIAKRKGITVVEDCCLAFGSKYKGKTVGTFGRASYYSFQWNKPYTTGLGGMVIVNDEELAKKIASVCESQMVKPGPKEVLMLAAQLAAYRMFVYPWTTAAIQALFRYLTNKGAVIGSWTTGEFTSPIMPDGFFKGMSAVQARCGIKQLKKIEWNIAHRKKMARLYDELLNEKGWHCRRYDTSTIEPVMVRYPVRIIEKKKALKGASIANIELGSWFDSPLHPGETPLSAYDYEMGMCPQAEKAAREVVNLPLHPRVSKKTAMKAVEFIIGYTEAL